MTTMTAVMLTASTSPRDVLVVVVAARAGDQAQPTEREWIG
jgi:hypothetical protein